MSRKFRLASVLRVRRVQEEVVRAELVRANRKVSLAWTDAERRAALLAARRGPIDGTAAAYLGALTAGLARAADLQNARAAHELAVSAASEASTDWSQAAGKVTALESLEVRHIAAVRKSDEAIAQREADDRSGAAFMARVKAKETEQ